MEITGPESMSRHAVRAITVADEDVATRFFEQHEGKIFRTHGWFQFFQNTVFPDHLGHDLRCKSRFRLVINQRWVIAPEAKFHIGTESRSGMRRNLPHATLNQIERLHGECADGAYHFCRIRNDIGRTA